MPSTRARSTFPSWTSSRTSMPGALSSTADPFCDAMPLSGSSVCSSIIPSRFVCRPSCTSQPMEPQICKIYLAFTNSIVIGVASTALCVTIGSMAAYALARIQYKPKFGNIMIFVVLTLAGHRGDQLCRHSTGMLRRPWPWRCSSFWRAPSASISRPRSAMATSCSGSFRSASCRRSSSSFRST